MRPEIEREPTFDPLQLFTPEEPVEGARPTQHVEVVRPAQNADTRWRPTFVPVVDDRPPLRRTSRAARFGVAAAASLAAGIIAGFASGYFSAQWLMPLSASAPQEVTPSRPDATSPGGTALPATDARRPESGPSQPEPAGTPGGSVSDRAPVSASSQVPVGPQEQSVVDREPAGSSAEARVPVATSLRAREGSIEVVSLPPGANVALDGRIVGKTPLTIPNVEEGTHVIGIELAGFSRWATSVRVEPGKPTHVGASLTP